ncbi:MAG: hypothetical protein JO047_17810 [Alphaproteobacteria bacterium]|nr:hypothetical protein [Alphaproteobacteria bacterium]
MLGLDASDAALDAGSGAVGRLDRPSAIAARWRRVQDFFLPGAFLAAIAVVLALTNWTGPESAVAELENRNPAPLPPAPRSIGELADYPQRFGAFFADRFGLRRELVGLRARLALEPLQQSPSPMVIVGRHGWLFYAGNSSLENWLHRLPFSPAELEQWTARLAERERWFAAHGIAYLFVVAPDKQTIYPEYMPRYLRSDAGTTRLDQLSAQLAGDARWFDLRPTLREAKAGSLVYFRTDTHWNGRGAYAAYRAIMERLRLPALTRSDAVLRQVSHPTDLARMSGIAATEPDAVLPPACAVARPTTFDAARLAPVRPGPVEPAFKVPATDCAGGHGRLLIFHDSFALPMSRYLSETFARAVFVWRRPTLAQIQAMVAAEQPTVVIEQRVERFLTEPLDP